MKIFVLFFATLFYSNLFAQFFNVKKVDEMYFEIDQNQNFNKGTSFTYFVKAKLSNGKIKNVDNNSNLIIESEGIKITGTNTMLILPSNNCDKEIYKLKFTYSEKDYSFNGEASIVLNYKGMVICDFSGEKGIDGTDGDKAKLLSNLTNNDGVDGENGIAGGKGTDGEKIKSYVYKDPLSDMILIDVLRLSDSAYFCYKTTKLRDGIYFLIKGGDGGNGGEGGNGRNGKKESDKTNRINQEAGVGGNGGRGGNGGDGGNGGNVELFLDESLKAQQQEINFELGGGKSGVPGKGGKPGSAGRKSDGTIAPNTAINGKEGSLGSEGQRSRLNEVIIKMDSNFKL